MGASPAQLTSRLSSRTDEFVCWSRMQAEAGQSLDAIITRKEYERRAGNGAFLWGVGNAPAIVAKALARAQMPVRAIFSIMKSHPKTMDVAPKRTVIWRRYIDASGGERLLPRYALVTSRADSLSGPKKTHYALMCYSDEPLALRRGGEPFDPSAFRNAGGTGSPVGHSQVTALLRRVSFAQCASDYEINLSAWLAEAYWVRLTDPILVTSAKQKMIERATRSGEAEWIECVTAVREGPGYLPSSPYATGHLF